MKLREGVIKALSGDVVHVRRPGGRCESVAVSRLRLPGQKSQISEFVEVVFAGARAKEAVE